MEAILYSKQPLLLIKLCLVKLEIVSQLLATGLQLPVGFINTDSSLRLVLNLLTIFFYIAALELL